MSNTGNEINIKRVRFRTTSNPATTSGLVVGDIDGQPGRGLYLDGTLVAGGGAGGVGTLQEVTQLGNSTSVATKFTGNLVQGQSHSTNESFAQGESTASGLRSHSEGIGTTASGDYSHAEGNATTSSGNFSHAEGNATTSSGQFSHAEGDKRRLRVFTRTQKEGNRSIR